MTKYIIILLFPFIGISQPTLTNDFAPNFGDQFNAQFIDNPNFNPGPEGANQIWDFSSLQGQFELHFNILDPADTPESEEFPGASFVWNIVEFETFFYYLSNEDSISQMGNAVATDTETTFLVINSDLEDALQFPITFGTSYNYHTAYDNYLFGSLIFSGQRDGSLTADGYGTIITPYGTYDNVLRLKIVTSEFGFNNTQYVWYDEKSFLPILVYESSDDPEENPSLYYTDIDLALASKDMDKINTPNIFFSYASNSIIFNSMELGQKFENIQLSSIDGNLIQSGIYSNSYIDSVNNKFKLNNSLRSGIYILSYVENDVARSIPIYIGM